MQNKNQRNKSMSAWLKIILFLLGIVITTWGFTGFLVANNILSGGLPGLCLLLLQKLGWDPSISQWAIGLLIFALGWFTLGRAQTLSALAGSLLLPAAIWLSFRLPQIRVICEQPILASIAGGFIIGLGLGLIFKANASVGGFSLIARVITKYWNIPVSRTLLILDSLIILIAGTFFGIEAAILAILSVASMMKAIDIVLTGIGRAKAVNIITDKKEDMREMLTSTLNCGATEVDVRGAYEAGDKTMFYCVIPVTKVAKLRRNILYVDPSAFTIINDASEVLGYGFKGYS